MNNLLNNALPQNNPNFNSNLNSLNKNMLQTPQTNINPEKYKINLHSLQQLLKLYQYMTSNNNNSNKMNSYNYNNNNLNQLYNSAAANNQNPDLFSLNNNNFINNFHENIPTYQNLPQNQLNINNMLQSLLTNLNQQNQSNHFDFPQQNTEFSSIIPKETKKNNLRKDRKNNSAGIN
jgi:hypothetical protein